MIELLAWVIPPRRLCLLQRLMKLTKMRRRNRRFRRGYILLRRLRGGQTEKTKNEAKIGMKTRYHIAIVAALVCGIALAARAQYIGPTNFMAWNFDDSSQVVNWGNWFGGDFVSCEWDPSDANNNPNSGSIRLTVDCGTSFAQWVLYDGWTPYYAPLPIVGDLTFTNLSFDMRYDESSAIRTNADGSLDFGVIRVGSRSSDGGQRWYYYWTVPATNAAGLPNTNWIHISVDLRSVPQNFPDLAGSGLLDTCIAADNGNYNPTLRGIQIIYFDNIQYRGYVAPAPPPTMAINKATPSLVLFGGSGIYGRSQLAIQGDMDSWVDGPFPVTYSFTILDNATEPGGLDTHIHFIGGGGNASYYDWGQPNVLWLQIISGSGTNTECVANLSWKTNRGGINPVDVNVALRFTNAVLAGKWTLTFLSNTNGTVQAPGRDPMPFNLAPLTDDDVRTLFGNPLQVRIGHQNWGNIANAGIPRRWGRITVTNAFTQIDEDFTKKGDYRLDTNIWNLATGDGTGLYFVVPTNAPYWLTWTTPDIGFSLIAGSSLANISNWGTPADVPTTLQAGLRWALITASSLPAGSEGYFALIKRPFTQLQVLLPGETNAPGTPTGKVGTPLPINLGESCNVTVNAVDPTYHIVTYVSGDVIALGCSDPNAFLPNPAPLANGTVTMQVYFGSTGSFTVTATNTTNPHIPPATSSPVTVVSP